MPVRRIAALVGAGLLTAALPLAGATSAQARATADAHVVIRAPCVA